MLIFLAFLLSACNSNRSSAEIKSATDFQNQTKNTVSGSDASAPSRQIEAAQKLVEKDSRAPESYNKLAAAYIGAARETGDFSLNTKAETAVSRALEIAPDNLTALKLKASLHATFHRFADALELATQLKKANPNDAFLDGVLTDANVELGNYPQAVEAVQEMVDTRPNMESYARVSYVRSLHGDSAGAIEAMKTASRIADPLDKEATAWCMVHLGDELFKTGDYAAAEQQYEAALQTFPDYHFALAGKGRTRAAAGDYENAVKFFTASQNRVPLTPTVIALGDSYTKLGDESEAQKQYELAEFIEQKFGNIDRRTLALLWADHDTKLDEALEIAENEHAARKDIFTADIYAWCLYKKERFNEAKKAAAEAMRLKTKDARIFYHAGMIEKSLGNKKEAERLLQTALKTNPSFDILQADKAHAALDDLKERS